MSTRGFSVVNYGPGKLVVKHMHVSRSEVFTVIGARSELALDQHNLPAVVSAPGGPQWESHGLLVLNHTLPAVKVRYTGPRARVIKPADEAGWRPPETVATGLLRRKKTTTIPAQSEAGFARGNLPLRIE